MKITSTFSLLLCSVFLLAITNAYSSGKLASEKELFTGKEFKNAFANPKDHPARPNVLIIGDSISIGYTVPVRKLLKGKADVYRIPTNGKYASFGLKNLDKWIGNRKWDVIHFNWGLWDICYRNPKSKNQGHRDKVNGSLTTTPEQYKKIMTEIILKLKGTNATLIWCSTTPVPEFEVGRRQGDEIAYNNIVKEIADKNGVIIDDLHSHALLKTPEIQINKGDVHFTKEGYLHLAEKVAQSIIAQISTRENEAIHTNSDNLGR